MANYAFYCLHKLKITPRQFDEMDRYEKAFIIPGIKNRNDHIIIHNMNHKWLKIPFSHRESAFKKSWNSIGFLFLISRKNFAKAMPKIPNKIWLIIDVVQDRGIASSFGTKLKL